MQVHTREAIKRKALIPICNCFSISTVLLTGPKSGNALSPVSNLSKSELRVYACVLLFFFPPPPAPLVRIRRSTRVSRAASVKDRRQPKTPEEAASELVAYRKQIQHCREIESRSDAGPRTRRFYDELCTTSRVLHVLTHLTVLLSCF